MSNRDSAPDQAPGELDHLGSNQPDLEKTGESGFRSRTRVRFALRLGDREQEIAPGDYVLGRGVSCDVVLAKPLVSREHAKLCVRDTTVTLEDLGSLNGVFVNSVQVRKPIRLSPGDTIMLGDETLHLILINANDPARTEVTLNDLRASPPVPEAVSETTRRADVFELLGGLVDKAFALGRGAEAERLLAGHLAVLFEHVQAGVPHSEDLLNRCGAYALRLADITGKPAWIEYTLKLYTAAGSLLPLTMIDELYDLLRRVRGVNVRLLRTYLEMLVEKDRTFSPTQRFALKRIAGLERLILL